MSDAREDKCGKCGNNIDSKRRVDIRLRSGLPVCQPSFVKSTREFEDRFSDLYVNRIFPLIRFRVRLICDSPKECYGQSRQSSR
jgi:hypothetical protein